jgi:hypothetical protein
MFADLNSSIMEIVGGKILGADINIIARGLDGTHNLSLLRAIGGPGLEVITSRAVMRTPLMVQPFPAIGAGPAAMRLVGNARPLGGIGRIGLGLVALVSALPH